VKKKRLLALALHGWGSYYHDPLVEQGRLPHIREMMARGSAGSLRSPYPISAATWVTMFTGQSVGVHGAIDYVQVDARTYQGTQAELADTAEFRDDTVFSILSRNGVRLAALFLPMTYPPWEVEGCMISGFPQPDERYPPTHPPELSHRIGVMAPGRLARLRYDDKAAVEHYLHETLSRIENVAVGTWQRDEPDAMIACLPMPDLAHHYFWSRDDLAAFERIYRIYDRIDEVVGRFLTMIDDDTYLMMFSDHGTGPAPSRKFHFNRWLAREGLLHVRSSLIDRLRVAAAVNRLIERAKRLRLHERVRGRLRGAVRRGVTSVTHNCAFVDWDRTRAYGIEFFYPLIGFEINLEGRQAQGIVPPNEYERLREHLCALLLDLVDPETGEEVCQEVQRREEMFHGPHLERFPDVVAVTNPNYDGRIQMEREVFSDNTGRCDYPFMGYHGTTGLFAICGPGIPQGQALPAAEMIDLAPSLLRLLGVPIPPSMEGAPFSFLSNL
jgi:predicted AlkP superfamily phosphohydrolase/phosphomutase